MIADILKNDLWVLIVLSINLAASVSYFIIISNPRLKEKFYKLPVLIQKIYVLFFVLPLFISPFLAHFKLDLNNISITIGLCLSIIGILFILLSFLKIGTVPSITKAGLKTSGVYQIVRHPIYAGTLIVFAGLNLLTSSAIPIFYFPVSMLLYYLMTYFEEKDLLKIYGKEYIDYREKVKFRLIPFVI
ncbi:MAG: isoprenylcysteine carboxylmethyltransferase family protein [Prolixibacteraceae bacterium]|nr:isoprenylcysteine carboxylmethyltransferase family protein [Prolixibacteraceae bacterium]